LISWWTADNTAVDLKGLNNASLFNGTNYVAGKVGQAFNLDGVDDRAQVADSDSLKLTGSMTIEAWVRMDTISPTNGGGVILFRGDDRGGLDPYQLTAAPGGLVKFQIQSLSNGQTTASLIAPLPLGVFSHVAATLDDATGSMRLYVNGALAAQTVTPVRPFRDLDPASNPSIGIGNHGGYPTTPHNFPFDGLIDELSVYNRAITPEEVQGIYGADIAGKIKSSSYFTPDYPTVTEGAAATTTTATFTVNRVHG
jgi:hypothetical protein